MQYDHYQWAASGSPKSRPSLRRATALVIRSRGEMNWNGLHRRVEPGDILIIPPGKEHAGLPVIDLWTLSAAVLILLAAARILL